MTIENYDPLTDDDDYCTVAYWYAMKGQKDFFRHYSGTERRPWGKAITYSVQAEELFKGQGTVIDDVDLPYELSCGQAVDLGVKKPGDKLVVSGLKAVAENVYTVGASTVQDPDLAKFDVFIGDKKIGATPEIYDGKKSVYDLGRAKLSVGDVPVTIVFTSQGKAIFDCFCLRPAQTSHNKIEAEKCQLKTTGAAVEKECVTLDWSNGYQVMFPATKVGDMLDMKSGVGWPHQDGEYSLVADITLGPDYGDFQTVFNDGSVGPVIKSYSSELKLKRGVTLGNVTVAKRHMGVTLKIVGKDEKSSGYKIGVDCFSLGKALVKGAIEAETAAIVDSKGAKPTTQELGAKWSCGTQLFFTPKEVGSYVTLETDVRENGKYDLDVYFTKSYDYAIIQVGVDGQKLGNSVDTYCPNVDYMGRISIGTVELKAGKHQIRFEAVGKNEQSKGVYMGIDCFTLKQIK
jgi:hypothetical protein